jgi:two-component system response regulator FlrC
VQRALILSENSQIDDEHILLEGLDWQDASSLQVAVEAGESVAPSIKPVAEASNVTSGSGLGGELRDQEYAIILDTLEECNGRRKEMAEKLGISPRTLRYKLAKMRDAGIEIPN